MEKRKKAETVPDIMNKTAKDVMNTECITVLENASIDEAVGIIVSQAIKRLPVLDVEGKFIKVLSAVGYETELTTAQIGNERQ